MKRRMIPSKVKKLLFAKSGGRCAFPNCAYPVEQSGLTFAEICHIRAFSPGGPRYDASESNRVWDDENLIVLCPTHHRIVDSDPEIYTVAWLKQAKTQHEQRIVRALELGSIEKPRPDRKKVRPLSEAYEIWESNQANADEEFWQDLFLKIPRLIAQAVPDHILLLKDKCYVGGKSFENTGGNIVDFLFVTQSTRNVTLVEIKTPATKLVGSKYRMNAYSMSEDLSGSVVQVLNYRNDFLHNFYALSQGASTEFCAVNPQCLIIAGSLENSLLDPCQRKSFELFRSSLGPVKVLTFDEIFGKIKDLIDLLADD